MAQKSFKDKTFSNSSEKLHWLSKFLGDLIQEVLALKNFWNYEIW